MNHSRRHFLQASAILSASGLIQQGWAADEKNPVPTVNERIQQEAQKAPLKMRFQGSTASECRQWQQKFKTKLQTLLGPYRPPTKWQTTVEAKDQLADHTRIQLVLSANGHPALPVYLLIPKGESEKRRGGILAIHGHSNHGYDSVAGRDEIEGVQAEIDKSNYDYGRQLVRCGYVVAVPCLTPFGRRSAGKDEYKGDNPCAITFLRMQALGKVLMAQNLRDCLWAFELLARQPQVNPERLGCVGLSYGGRMTMLTAAMEPRVRVAVMSGALNVLQERIQRRYRGGCQIIPSLLEHGDVPEIASLIAPRRAIWETGNSDKIIVEPWASEAFAQIERAYRALAVPNHLVRARFEGGHQWHGDLACHVFEQELQPQ